MKEPTTNPLVTIQVRLPQELLQWIDDYRQGMTMRPTRSQMMRFLLENARNILVERTRDESKT